MNFCRFVQKVTRIQNQRQNTSKYLLALRTAHGRWDCQVQESAGTFCIIEVDREFSAG